MFAIIKQTKMFLLNKIAKLIIIIGALNWGAVAYNGTDFVSIIAKAIGYPQVDKYIKLLVGAAGIYGLYMFVYWNFIADKSHTKL